MLSAKISSLKFERVLFHASSLNWKPVAPKSRLRDLLLPAARPCAVAILLFAATLATPAAPRPPQDQFPPSYIPSGQIMFKQYCAACHGLNATGRGPARAALKIPAADLTTIAKRHGGEFPYGYVTNVLRFGPGVAARGSSDMPT